MYSVSQRPEFGKATWHISKGRIFLEREASDFSKVVYRHVGSELLHLIASLDNLA